MSTTDRHKNGNGNGHYTAALFIAAIPGTGGIISTIARKVGCSWNTAKRYITEYPTVATAYDNEVNTALDVAESIIFDNLRLLRREQATEEKPVESSLAKWFLTTKGKDRGYTERQEHEQVGDVRVIFRSNVNDDRL